eukprot:PITA_26851
MMSLYGLGLEYALEGNSNYIAWKDRMQAALEDNELKELIDIDIPKPTDAEALAHCRKCVAKARRIILKDFEIILSQTSMDSANGREKLPEWEYLWSNLVQKEILWNTRDGTSPKEVEDDFSLVSKEKKSNGNKSQGEEGEKKDFSNIKFFHYYEFMHYATKCPQNKASKKEPEVATKIEDLASQFELDFSLIRCMASTVMGIMHYLYSGALFHMTGNRNLFNDLKEKDLKQNIEFGDDGMYNVTSIDIVTFYRAFGSLPRLTNVIFVLGLKKNLVSTAVLEDRGYDVIFKNGNIFLRHIATGHVKQNIVRVKNLYGLQV